MEGSVAIAGAIAAVLSALATLGGVSLSRRAHRSAEATKAEETKRLKQAATKEYLEQLQGWSADIYAEKDRMLEDCRRRCDDQVRMVRGECEAELERIRTQHTRILEDLRVQTRAQVIGARRREDYWQRAFQGRLRDDEQPPPGERRGREE